MALASIVIRQPQRKMPIYPSSMSYVFFQNSANEGSASAKYKIFFGTKDNSYSCMKKCLEEYEKDEIEK